MPAVVNGNDWDSSAFRSLHEQKKSAEGKKTK
jgi:hypothetical protein